MKFQGRKWPFTQKPAHFRHEPEGCVEVLGGNETRTQALVLADLELLLVARAAEGLAGGDLYCVHSCNWGRLVKIVLADVTGHGKRSRLIASDLHQLLHEHSTRTSPRRLLGLVNRQFTRFAPSGILAASLCAVYDPCPGEFRYAYGGQPLVLFWSELNGSWSSLAPEPGFNGPPFGVTEAARYDEQSILLRAGDILLMFSDGVPEARNTEGAILGPGGVLRLAQECTKAMGSGLFALPALADAFLRRLHDFQSRLDFRDDVTILWARRLTDNWSETSRRGLFDENCKTPRQQ